jgi:peroxiredoxin
VARLKIGDKAVSFTLKGVDDKQHSLDNYSGKQVVIIFSCNHCPYVQAWEDRMVKIQADYGAKNVQLIAINSNDGVKYPDDSFPKMKERARTKRFNFPYLHDEDQKVASAYGAERTPEVFLFDSNLTLRYHGTIDDNYDSPDNVKENYLRDALDATVAGRKVSRPETAPVGCTIKWK